MNFKIHSNGVLLRKYAVRYAHFSFDFISVYLFVFTFAMKLKDLNYKSHQNILVSCDQCKWYQIWFMFHGKMSDFVSFYCLGSLLPYN